MTDDKVLKKLLLLVDKFARTGGHYYDGDDGWQWTAKTDKVIASVNEFTGQIGVSIFGRGSDLGCMPDNPAVAQVIGFWTIYYTGYSPEDHIQMPEHYQTALDELQQAMILDALSDV